MQSPENPRSWRALPTREFAVKTRATLIFPVQAFFSTGKTLPRRRSLTTDSLPSFPRRVQSYRDVLAGPHRVCVCVCAIRRGLWSSEHAKCRLPPPPDGHVVTQRFGCSSPHLSSLLLSLLPPLRLPSPLFVPRCFSRPLPRRNLRFSLPSLSFLFLPFLLSFQTTAYRVYELCTYRKVNSSRMRNEK